MPKATKGEDHTKLAAPHMMKTHNFKERNLSTIDEARKIVSETFGRCFPAMYCNQYCVVVNKSKIPQKKKVNRPNKKSFMKPLYLWISEKIPESLIYLVCTLYTCPFTWFLNSLRMRVTVLPSQQLQQPARLLMKMSVILKQTCEVLMFIDTKRYFHNDLKGTMSFWMVPAIQRRLSSFARATHHQGKANKTESQHCSCHKEISSHRT